MFSQETNYYTEKPTCPTVFITEWSNELHSFQE